MVPDTQYYARIGRIVFTLITVGQRSCRFVWKCIECLVGDTYPQFPAAVKDRRRQTSISLKTWRKH